MTKIKVTSSRLCQEAGRDPEEQITKFVLDDLAGALIEAEWSASRIVKYLRIANLKHIEDALCESSNWTAVFQDYATAYEEG